MLRRTLLKAAPCALTALLFATVAGLPGQAGAQTAGYPNKPVTIIVPFTAGGNTDAFARMVGDELDKSLGQRFLVENKPGAGGNLGAAQVARATPDGYTLVSSYSAFPVTVTGGIVSALVLLPAVSALGCRVSVPSALLTACSGASPSKRVIAAPAV